jgi:hypothetical protein
MARDDCRRSDCPRLFGRKPSSITAASTRAIVVALAGPDRLITRETVESEQPARSATCLMLVRSFLSSATMCVLSWKRFQGRSGAR